MHNIKVLYRYILILPELSNKFRCDFENSFFVHYNKERTQHHELRGKILHFTQNIIKLSAIFHQHGKPFKSNDKDEIHSLLTKSSSAMNKAVINEILMPEKRWEMWATFIYLFLQIMAM